MVDAARPERHWAAQKERGSFAPMQLTALALRLLGRQALAPLLYLIVLYFFVSSARARRNTWQYQAHLAAWGQRPDLAPSWRGVFAQFMAFGESLLDRLDAWRGRLRYDQVMIRDPHGVRQQMLAGGKRQRGQILLGAHLGNLEVCRAMAELGEQVTLNVLVHTQQVAHFKRLQHAAGDQHLNLLQVSELDAAMMLELSQRLDRGEWLAIAGDRIALHGGRSVEVDFLGQRAAFPQGPWLMAGLLRCPVNLMCCLKIEGRYHIVLEPFLTAPAWTRDSRDASIESWAQRYAERLGQLCLEAPRQWFNFYAFWQRQTTGVDDAR